MQTSPAYTYTRKRMLPALLAVLLTVAFPLCAHGFQLEPMASVGISGGPIFSIAVSSDSNKSVYIGTGTGIYKSIQGEDIWTPSTEGLTSDYIYDIVVFPLTGTTLYCTADDGVFKSTDGGEKWASAGLDSQTYDLLINPVTKTWFAAGTTEGVFTSTDSGSAWTSDATGPDYVYSLVVDPDTPATLYAGSFGKGIFKSTDFGTSWSKLDSSPDNNYHLAINPDDTDVLYSGTTAGLYKSTNGGSSWSLTGTEFSTVSVYSVAVDTTSPAKLYVATDKGAFKSTNSGSAWTAINSGFGTEGSQGPFVREVAIDPADEKTLYAGTYSGNNYDVDMYKSTNSGTSWTQINRELSNTLVHSLAFDPADTSLAYAGTSTVGILKSTNGGLSWGEVNEGLLNTYVRSVAVNPDSSAVYAGTPSGLFVSSDAGEAWDEAGPSHNIYTIGVDPETTDNLYIGTNEGIFLSTDEGEAWVSLNNNLANPFVYGIVFDPEDDDTIYVATNGDGIFKSTTAGESWVAANDGLDSKNVISLVINPLNAEVLYAGTSGGGLYKTTDSGDNWESADLDNESSTVNDVVVKPDDPDIVYTATAGNGFYRSTDGGGTWDAGDTTLATRAVYDLAIDPDNTQRLLIALKGEILVRTFNTPPDVPSQPSPADGAINQQLTKTLSWTGGDPDVGDTLTYKVYFGTDTNPENNLAQTTTVTEYDPGTLQLSQTYYWKVAAVDGYNAETEGDTWHFTTIISNPPNKPSGPSPANGAEEQSWSLTLSWTGGDPDSDDTVSYDVYFGTLANPPLVKRSWLETSYTHTALLRPLNTYYWRIVARDNNGLETGGDVWSFATALIPPECVIETTLADEPAMLEQLRTLRDTVLVKTDTGKRLINSYYVLSPVLLRFARQNPVLTETLTDFYKKRIFPLVQRGLQNGDLETYQAPLESECNNLDTAFSSIQPALKHFLKKIKSSIGPMLKEHKNGKK